MNTQGFIIEAIAMTSRTRQGIHITSHDIPSILAVCFMVASVNIGDHSFKAYINVSFTTKIINIMKMKLTVS